MSQPGATVRMAELLAWLGGVFQEDPSNLGPERRRDSLPTWDSMGTLLLIAELDDKLKITLSEGELKELTSIGDIVTVLTRKGVTIVD